MSGCDKGQIVHEAKILSSWPFTERQFTQFLPRYSQATDTPLLSAGQDPGTGQRSRGSTSTRSAQRHCLKAMATTWPHPELRGTWLRTIYLLAEETLLMVFLKVSEDAQ